MPNRGLGEFRIDRSRSQDFLAIVRVRRADVQSNPCGAGYRTFSSPQSQAAIAARSKSACNPFYAAMRLMTARF